MVLGLDGLGQGVPWIHRRIKGSSRRLFGSSDCFLPCIGRNSPEGSRLGRLKAPHQTKNKQLLNLPARELAVLLSGFERARSELICL